MNKKLQIDHLDRLLHMEVHLVSACDSAIGRVHGEDARTRLEQVRDDHEQHVLDIAELLREMGEPAPAQKPEVESLFAPGSAALRNANTDEDVLQAVRIMQQVLARQYEEARSWAVGVQVHEVLARNDEDEHRDLDALGELVGAAPHGSSSS
jgi:hypothetical protein